MALSSVPIIVLLVAVAILIIVRQFQVRPVSLLPLVAAPIALLALGSRAVADQPGTTANLALFAADVILALFFGIWRGTSFRIWMTPDGQSHRQGTRVTLGLWLASIALRAVMVGAERLASTGRDASFKVLPFVLGLTLLAQGLVILWRADRLVPSTSTH